MTEREHEVRTYDSKSQRRPLTEEEKASIEEIRILKDKIVAELTTKVKALGPPYFCEIRINFGLEE